jgi:glycosyltransferase involved in cell wall biosynthesis
MKKIKILYLDIPLDPPGGGQVSLFYILKNINKKKFEIKVFVPYECEFVIWLKNENIDVEIVQPKDLLSKIKKFSPDIIHCNSPTTRYTAYAVFFSQILKISFIWHNRTLDTAGWKEKLIAKLATKIVVISDAVKEKFKGFEDKIVKIYNAVDTEVFKPIDVSYLKKELKISKDKKIVGSISRLDWWKGYDLFLEVAKKITKINNNVLFLIAGDGPEKEKIINFIEKHNLSSKIIFLGFQKNIVEIINLCDIVVNLSTQPEPFGRTIIEAMSCGKVVIATNLGGPKEIIENGIDGFLVEPKVDEICELVSQVLSDKTLYEKISLSAIKKVKEEFSLQKQIQQIEELYYQFL